MLIHRIRMCLIVVLLTSAAGCSGTKLPDLKRLYHTMEMSTATPVIIVHGILGARLADGTTGEELWPGPVTRILFSDYRSVALGIDAETLLPMPTNLVVSGITDQAAGQDFYGRIIKTLEIAGGFKRGQLGVPAGANEKRYYVFAYDWRYDNVASARKLDDLISDIRRDYGDPTLKVDIVAHSMGGLLTRYYARYGTTDVLDGNEFVPNNHGADRLRRVVLLGTPSLGSLSAFQSLVFGHKIGLQRIPVDVLVTMPSIYQLLPHAINDWILKPDGTVLDRDIFDVKIWRAFQWGIFDPQVQRSVREAADTAEQGDAKLELLVNYFSKHIERARRFSWSLSVPAPNESIAYIVFGGDCEETPARILVEEIGGDSVVRFMPDEVSDRRANVDYERMMLEPGDGLVTNASLLARHALDPAIGRHRYSNFNLGYPVFLCEEHDQLTGNINFQDNLLHALLSFDLR